MNILLLSPYHAHSHRIWCEQLIAQFPEYTWQLLSLPPRHFSWRIRGNSLIWRTQAAEVLQTHFDLIFATSMTELNSLLGFFPKLATIPSILYFHENQFAYPVSDKVVSSIEPQIVQLYSALTASRAVFNSHYNRTSFMQGAKALLEKLPDDFPRSIIDELNAKAQVIPVPIIDEFFLERQQSNKVFSIAWNHRWEYDKWPECFFNALLILQEQKIPFELYVMGQHFRYSPPVFDKMRKKLAVHIKHWGRVDMDKAYREILGNCHVAVSTALHDFQGLAMLEATALGLVSLVPDRLAYPEWFNSDQRYTSIITDPDLQSHVLATRLQQLYQGYLAGNLHSKTDVTWLSWKQMRPAYKRLIDNSKEAQIEQD